VNDAKWTLLVGAGVVGLPTAVQLAAADVPLILCDDDIVTEENLRKQRFFARHVGLPKVIAADDLIHTHVPKAKTRLLPVDARSLGVGFLLEHVGCVIACVDGRGSESFLARQCNVTGLPYVREATRGESRVVDVTFVPPPHGPTDPCGGCTFTETDLALADARYRCGGNANNPDAGALTFAEHGALAASLAVDALLRNELAPARTIRFGGGPQPRLDTTLLPSSSGCLLADPRWGHGPANWVSSGRMDQLRVGQLLDAACEQLGSSGEELTCQFDVALCPERLCRKCGASMGPGFYHHGTPDLCCERCGGLVEQCPRPPVREVNGVVLESLADRTLAELGAPRGVGFRFVNGKLRQFNICAAAGAI
jgi:molybdopterin/thiamine biosynthesis adenylyltransferase